jgi:hypothetical protein
MSPRPDPVDPLVLRKRHLLFAFYAGIAGSAMAFATARYSSGPWRGGLLSLSLAASILAVWTLVSFLRVIDEFEARYLHGGLKFAFVGTLALLMAESFLESLGFPRVPAYGNAAGTLILWTLGLGITSWKRHSRWGYEE